MVLAFTEGEDQVVKSFGETSLKLKELLHK